MLSLGARLYVRLLVQKQFTLDDAFAVFGVCLLLASVVMLFQFVDNMFVAEALSMNPEGLSMNLKSIASMPGVIHDALDFNKWITANNIILWTATNTVKFSFLSLFRRLISRIRSMSLYWWVVVVYTILVWIFWVSTYFIPCPKIGNPSASGQFLS